MLPVKSSSLELGLVRFTITATNNSSVDATSVEVADTLGTSLSYLYHATSSGKYDPSSGIWSIGTLGARSSRTLSIDARIDSGTIGASLENAAGVLSLDQSDPNLSNNFAVAIVNVLGPPAPTEQEPTYDSAVDRMVWSDSFDRYASYALMDDANADKTYGLRTGDGFGYNPTHQALSIPGRNGTGQAIRSILLDDPLHRQQSSNWVTPKGTGAITRPTAKETMVFSFWFRTSPGGSPAPFGNKWFEWWPVGGSDRTQVGLVGSQRDYLGVNHSMIWRLNAASRTTDGPGSAYQVRGPYWDGVNDGQWHRWTLMYRSNSVDNYPNAGSRDGIVRVWVDGTKVMDVSAAGVGIVPLHGVRPWCTWQELDTVRSYAISYALWPGTHNGTDVGYTIDYDDLQWWVEDGV